MTTRPSALCLFLLTVSATAMGACVPLEADELGGSEAPIADPTCFTEDPGCGCTPGTEPTSCVHTEEVGDRIVCEAGAMYCVSGVWSECETVETWEIPRPKLIQTPGECSPCEPDCFISNDEPDATDLNRPDLTSSTNAQFVAGPPRGIRPIPTITSGTGSPDTDGDGVPNAADDCPTVAGMARYFGCTTGVGTGGFFHVLPPGATAQDPLEFDIQLNDVDLYFLIDTTLSMGGEIDNLQSSLTSGTLNYTVNGVNMSCTGGVIGCIRARLPNTWFGVGKFEEYQVGSGPNGAYGSSNSRPYVHHADMSSNTATARTAIDNLVMNTGGAYDLPETQSQALYSVATGNGLSFWGAPRINARTGCPAGRWGYPCFRPNAIPVVFVVTDAVWHNGPNPAWEYYGPAYTTSVQPDWPADNAVRDIGSVNGSYRQFGSPTSSSINSAVNTHGSCASSGSRERYVRFSVTTTAPVIMDTYGSSYNTVLYLYSGTNATAGSLIACDSDGATTPTGGASNAARLVRILAPGTYTLRIDGASSNNGRLQLQIGTTGPSGAITYAQSIAALNSRGVYVMGAVSSAVAEAEDDLNAASVATGAVSGQPGPGNGLPFNQVVSSTGTGLSGAVVNSVYALTNSVRMNVDVVAENVQLLPGIPASALIQSVTVSGGCPGGCTGSLPTGCASCLPGTDLPFTVTFRNNVIPQTAMDQVFNFSLIVRANLGATELQRVPVRIVVPGMVATTTYSTATFSRTFDPDTDGTCQIPPTRPDWGMFTWNVTTPGDSSVVFHFRTAETLAELDTVMAQTSYAVPAGPDVPTAAQQINIGDRIALMGGQNYLPYMRVTAVLNPSSNGTQAPTLTSMGLQYGCVDSE